MAYISKFTASDGVTYDLKDSEAIKKYADHIITGSAGWYKFFERQSNSGSAARKTIFLIQEAYGSNRSAIISLYNYRNSTGNWTNTKLNVIASSLYSNEDFAMYYSGDTLSLYVKKYSANNYPLCITIFSSLSGSNGSYVEQSDLFKSVATASLPSGAIYATACSDGAGNIISDTYARNESIASVEESSTASRAYSVGKYLIFEGSLYKVTSAIASGETITPGTNVTSVLVSDHMENTSNPHNVTATQVGLGNVANVLQYSASNKPSAADVTYSGSVGGVTVSNVKDALDYVPSGSNSTPYENTSPGSAGTSTSWSRSDHVHPSDSTKVSTSRRINNKQLNSDLVLFWGLTLTIPLSWSGTGPYTNTSMTVTEPLWGGLTSKSKVSLQPTAAQIAQLQADGVTALTIENNNGVLTAYALGAAPTTAMTIDCTVMEVET